MSVPMSCRTFLYITSLLGCFHLQSAYVLAELTPPPPGISYRKVVRPDEDERFGIDDSVVNIRSWYQPSANGNWHGLNIYQGGHVDIRAPYMITIGAGGINVYGSDPPSYISGSGVLTSSDSFLNIWLWGRAGEVRPLWIDSVISDNGANKVGLRISGGVHSAWEAVVLSGDKSNTFTGPVEVSGWGNVITLNKTKGAIAIRGDIFINDQAALSVGLTRQIARNSTVRLRNSTFSFVAGLDESVLREESFHKLVVEGKSLLLFELYGSLGGKRFLYLDDLSIDNGAELEVRNWVEGAHFFLVRKTSSGLEDALKRIAFEGYLPGRTHLEEYNKDYWMISGTPEPATYGAIFAGGGLGLVLLRRKRRSRRLFYLAAGQSR